jgi:hypothetical protein
VAWRHNHVLCCCSKAGGEEVTSQFLFFRKIGTGYMRIYRYKSPVGENWRREPRRGRPGKIKRRES